MRPLHLVGAAVGYAWYQRVAEYEQLYQSYRQRRAALLADMPDPADTTEPPEPIAVNPAWQHGITKP